MFPAALKRTEALGYSRSAARAAAPLGICRRIGIAPGNEGRMPPSGVVSMRRSKKVNEKSQSSTLFCSVLQWDNSVRQQVDLYWKARVAE
jgi:hypothetical protein